MYVISPVNFINFLFTKLFFLKCNLWDTDNEYYYHEYCDTNQKNKKVKNKKVKNKKVKNKKVKSKK
jgi:hypothetical protein